MKTIGIIGGAGVIAANSLLSRIESIVTATGARFDQQHPETIMLHATQAPSRSMFFEGRGPTFVPAYIQACERLSAAGADFAAMCCNTAHGAFFEIEKASPIPVINMVAEAIMFLQDFPDTVRPIGLLCSDGTRQARVYEAHAEALGVDMQFIYPREDVQANVTQLIRAIKSGKHRKGDGSPLMLDEILAHMKQIGAGTVLLGCTELHLAYSGGREVIDTVEILAKACIRESGALDGAH